MRDTLKPAADTILHVENLSKFYPIRTGLLGRKAVIRSLDDVSFAVARGETLGIVGESGCGKSTLAKSILRLHASDGGRIRFSGADILPMSERAFKPLRRRIQMVFQDPFGALDPRMTIRQSLLAPLQQNRIGTGPERAARVREMLNLVGLDDSFLDRRTTECSGGQLQRVVVARALLLDPEILICDEPTSALDASIRATILNLLVSLKRNLGLTLIVISHDLKSINFLCDRVAVMYMGKFVEIGATDDIFRHPKHPYTRCLMNASFMGDQFAMPEVLRGELPSPINPPAGCHFHPRCAMARESCARERPQLGRVHDGHLAACHFPLADPA